MARQLKMAGHGDAAKRKHDLIVRLVDLVPHSAHHTRQAGRGTKHDRIAGMSAFMMLGGASTLASYAGAGAAAVPSSHRTFLGGLPLAWHDESIICIHGMIGPHESPDDPPHVQSLWGSVIGSEPHASGRTVICGHVSQRSGVPLDLGHTLCIDTGIKRGGWLTVLDATSWTYIQSDAEGHVRAGQLRKV